MLTGGRSASQLYAAWAPMLAATDWQGMLHFYFGDERCVPPEDPDCNYRVAITTLFPQGVPASMFVHRIEAERADADAVARRYQDRLPERIDIVLLSMGDDGHIASLFPFGAGLHETMRRVLPVIGSKLPALRITITPLVLRGAREIFVMAIGEQKRALYTRLRENEVDIDTFPARLVLGGTWIFGGA
jgi:6-phosphogluconolactonase/glucosamine-6-phosphate isomerase/deaminase